MSRRRPPPNATSAPVLGVVMPRTPPFPPDELVVEIDRLPLAVEDVVLPVEDERGR